MNYPERIDRLEPSQASLVTETIAVRSGLGIVYLFKLRTGEVLANRVLYPENITVQVRKAIAALAGLSFDKWTEKLVLARKRTAAQEKTKNLAAARKLLRANGYTVKRK